jgi:hypothetical protein
VGFDFVCVIAGSVLGFGFNGGFSAMKKTGLSVVIFALMFSASGFAASPQPVSGEKAMVVTSQHLANDDRRPSGPAAGF